MVLPPIPLFYHPHLPPGQAYPVARFRRSLFDRNLLAILRLVLLSITLGNAPLFLKFVPNTGFSDLKGVELSSIYAKSQVVSPVLTE